MIASQTSYEVNRTWGLALVAGLLACLAYGITAYHRSCAHAVGAEDGAMTATDSAARARAREGLGPARRVRVRAEQVVGCRQGGALAAAHDGARRSRWCSSCGSCSSRSSASIRSSAGARATSGTTSPPGRSAPTPATSCGPRRSPPSPTPASACSPARRSRCSCALVLQPVAVGRVDVHAGRRSCCARCRWWR